ncbi:vacuolar protein 8-like [Papaver somniferum]|uniref:vacuolar protein 8-like n=1 Tax=Papaver somniferum TaxID=3469 RepID=UPI000E7046CF|nr:vacuolar protein 8-like [Papaver somniferum]
MSTEMGEEGKEPVAVDEESSLTSVIRRISVLISHSNSIKVFHGKWQLIRGKLEELNSGLKAAENCEFGENFMFSEMIPDILVTVNESSDLANRCINLTYSGKLLMQSDLDIICSQIDFHLKKLTGIYNAGNLTLGSAIVVSKPSFGCSKDDMKFYVNDLLTRMKVGGSDMKIQALKGLSEVTMEDEKYVKIVIDTGEIVGILVEFLEFTETEIQEESMKTISAIAGFDLYKGVLVGAGTVAPLIRVLESGSELGKERAARILQKLTENSDNAWLVSAHGGVTALLKMCTTNNGDQSDSISPACGVLKNLAGVEEIKRFMVEEDAVPAFVKLMRSKDESLQINAIEFLQLMASGDESIRRIVVREGGIYSLVQILDPKASFSSKTRDIALRAIEIFCFNSSTSLSSLMGYGFLDRLLYILRSSEVSIQESALKVGIRLCGISEETKKAMGDANFMPEFIRLLDARSHEIRELASEVLSSMISVPKNRRKLIQEECNVSRVLQLLDPGEEKSGNKKFLLSILMSLTNCNSGRKKIAHSNYLKNLEKLAETDVSDAKKILRKLSTNRFRNILNGILRS